jgi:hypothetical protein
MVFTETFCISETNLQFCCYWFVAASSWSVQKLTKKYENTSCTVCPHLPSKLLHEYAQKFGTAHGRVSTLAHFFNKPKTGREVSKSQNRHGIQNTHALANVFAAIGCLMP